MKLKWTKSDAKRAEKMGWLLWPTSDHGRICKLGDRFKTDAEAARWVLINADTGRKGDTCWDVLTCRRAVLICCGGAR